jgi:hypothetical protein
MRHVTCDRCRRELAAGGEAHYTVTLESNRVSDGTPLTDDDFEDDSDSVEEMQLMLQRDRDDAGSCGEPPVRLIRKQFDFCAECYARFAADPLGLERASLRRFSSN